MSLSYSYANTLIKTNILGHDIEVIRYETNSPDYDLKIWIDTKAGSTLKEIMESVWAISGVTGVFTCPKDYYTCGGETTTINERYVNGEKIATYKSTGERVVLGWTAGYEAFIFQTDKINSNREAEIYEWLANHPLLILDWVPMTQSYWEKWLIDSKMRDKWTRNFICVNKDSSLYYFWLVNLIDIDNLAVVLKELWCYNAINLDAWFSTAMIYNWDYIRWPGRDILDWVFIVPKNINTGELDLQAKEIAKSFHNTLKNYRLEIRISLLEKFNPKIDEFLEKVNTQFSKTILTKNSLWYDMENGKEIQLSTDAVKRVYLLNNLQNEISILIWKYQQEIKIRDATLVFDLLF
jgi:hypothetical protein